MVLSQINDGAQESWPGSGPGTSMGATLGATGANNLPGIRTSMNSGKERVRGRGRT
jgi:hypothetical protein